MIVVGRQNSHLSTLWQSAQKSSKALCTEEAEGVHQPQGNVSPQDCVAGVGSGVFLKIVCLK